ncbi:MAG: hypothetical protein SGJ27_09015 [Candidatus Melainabacteria bacterium]|nr:hypothetical protein [Candidatus Melainabacteria bacterium]
MQESAVFPNSDQDSRSYRELRLSSGILITHRLLKVAGAIVSPSAIVLRIVLLVAAFCVLIAIFAFVLKLVFLVASLLGIALCMIAAYFIFRKLFFPSALEADTPRESKLRCEEGVVPMFREEPKVRQLVDKSMASLPKDVIKIDGEADVSVLEESDIALRIKVKSGDHKGRIGWVDKSYVTGYSQKR